MHNQMNEVQTSEEDVSSSAHGACALLTNQYQTMHVIVFISLRHIFKHGLKKTHHTYTQGNESFYTRESF